MTTRFRFLASISLAAVLTLSCGDSGTDFLASITNPRGNLLQNNRLGFQSSADGVPSGDDVALDVEIAGTALSGGSTGITVKCAQELDTLYIQIEGNNDMYYTWGIEEQDKKGQDENSNYVYYIVLEFSQSLGEGEQNYDETEINFVVSAKTKAGEYSEPISKDLPIMKVGTGALQISLSWDMDDDLDLHVIGPVLDDAHPDSLLHLYHSGRVAWDSAAVLDVDANADCSRNIGRNSENVFFKEPLKDGDYKVIVHLWQRCTVDRDGNAYDADRAGATYNVTANSSGFLNFSNNQTGKFADNLVGKDPYLPTLTNLHRGVLIGTITVRDGAVVTP